MNTENLDKLSQSIGFADEETRAAHSDAIEADDQFAEIVLLQLAADIAAIRSRVNAALTAAK